jgi:hypothetical protein
MINDIYNINGTLNLDDNPVFNDVNTYSGFQTELENFKTHLSSLVYNKENRSFYKFGDGDYFFLKQIPTGSATPGKRALNKSYDELDITPFTSGVLKNDYVSVEIYPKNRNLFNEIYPNKKIDFPAEFGYGLVANKWLFETFKGKIGIIGADAKVDLIKQLMDHDEYKEYIGLDKFEDYLTIPQKFACDDVDLVEQNLAQSLKDSTSEIFVVGIGHVKSALLHRLKSIKPAIYLDVGSGVDAIAGVIDEARPYMGNWINYHLSDYDYGKLDLLQYKFNGKIKKI